MLEANVKGLLLCWYLVIGSLATEADSFAGDENTNNDQ